MHPSPQVDTVWSVCGIDDMLFFPKRVRPHVLRWPMFFLQNEGTGFIHLFRHEVLSILVFENRSVDLLWCRLAFRSSWTSNTRATHPITNDSRQRQELTWNDACSMSIPVHVFVLWHCVFGMHVGRYFMWVCTHKCLCIFYWAGAQVCRCVCIVIFVSHFLAGVRYKYEHK